MSVLERAQADLIQAMRDRDRPRKETLSGLVAGLQALAKEGGGDELAVVRRERKQHMETAEGFRQAGRPNEAPAAEAKAQLLDVYLPAQMTDEELTALIADVITATGASSRKDMGRVMGALKPRIDGRADNARVARAVQAQLA